MQRQGFQPLRWRSARPARQLGVMHLQGKIASPFIDSILRVPS
jgi:hypothetical protein